MTKTLLTKDGFQKIQLELEELKAKRDHLITQIEENSQFNDEEGENALTVQLKEELEMTVSKIDEFEEAVLNSEIITHSGKLSTVQVGSKVKLRLTGSKEKEFHIVSELEADPTQNRISDQSPLGQALLGKKVDDEIEVSAPIGAIKYKIVALG